LFGINKIAPVPVVNPYPYIQNYEDIRRNNPDKLTDFSVWSWAIQQEYERMYPRHEHSTCSAVASIESESDADLFGSGVCQL